MDNNVNNNSVLNTAMPNDNNSNVNPTPDFNSVQPQSTTPVQDNSSNPPNSGLNVMGDNPTESFYQDPTSFENPKDNLTQQEQTQQPSAQESFTPVTDMNMPQASTEPVVQPTAVEETPAPVVDMGMPQAPAMQESAPQMPNIGNVEPTVEQNLVQESPSPVVDMSMPQPSTEPVVEQTPVQEISVDQPAFNNAMPQESMPTAQENSNMGMSQINETSVDQVAFNNTMPQGSMPTAQENSNMGMSQINETPVDQVAFNNAMPQESMPTAQENSDMGIPAPVEQGTPPVVDQSAQDTQPAFPNLSEPLTSPSTSTEMSEEMNTLQESKPEEKDSNVVIIVLILIIVLLLAGIGYFGYQIFLA